MKLNIPRIYYQPSKIENKSIFEQSPKWRLALRNMRAIFIKKENNRLKSIETFVQQGTEQMTSWKQNTGVWARPEPNERIQNSAKACKLSYESQVKPAHKWALCFMTN